MKKRTLVVLSLLLLTFSGMYAKLYDKGIALKSATHVVADTAGLKTGDIIFQTSGGRLSVALQLATRSIYSHCGLIFTENGKTYVLEAVQPVCKTPLNEWIARGKDGKYVIKRLKNADQVITASVAGEMKKTGNQLEGKDYDIYFEWSDNKIYCSELVWKIYKRATGIEIGKLEKLKDFDLTSREVRRELKNRYGNTIPMNETVISPVSIFNSELLTTVRSN